MFEVQEPRQPWALWVPSKPVCPFQLVTACAMQAFHSLFHAKPGPGTLSAELNAQIVTVRPAAWQGGCVGGRVGCMGGCVGDCAFLICKEGVNQLPDWRGFQTVGRPDARIALVSVGAGALALSEIKCFSSLQIVTA